jgi:hypothetical protein
MKGRVGTQLGNGALLGLQKRDFVLAFHLRQTPRDSYDTIGRRGR